MIKSFFCFLSFFVCLIVCLKIVLNGLHFSAILQTASNYLKKIKDLEKAKERSFLKGTLDRI